MDAHARALRLTELDSVELPGVPLAVLGDPIAHSLSPAMHNAALARMAKNEPEFADWRYLALQVPVEMLPAAVTDLHRRGFRGLNLTIPHKVAAVELVTALSAEGAAMGAVNTLVAGPAGFSGTNTDGWGIARAVENTTGRSLAERPLILCGAGGAARAIAVQALGDGVAELWIGNRGEANLKALLDQLAQAGLPTDRVRSFLFASPPSDLPGNALVVNATAAGLKAEDSLPLDLGFLGSNGAIYDTTYGCSNAWAACAAEKGLAYGDGLSMLVAQGARSLEIWTGRPVPVETMEAAAREALAARLSSR